MLKWMFKVAYTAAIVSVCALALAAANPYTWVGGPVATGSSYAGYNPVVVAGLTGGNNAQPVLADGNFTLLSNAARTATTNTALQGNYWYRGIIATLNVTAASGTGGLTVHIQGQDAISSAWYDVLVASSAVTATGLYTYSVYPGIGMSSVTMSVSAILPAVWRVSVVAGDSSSYTYSLGASENR